MLATNNVDEIIPLYYQDILIVQWYNSSKTTVAEPRSLCGIKPGGSSSSQSDVSTNSASIWFSTRPSHNLMIEYTYLEGQTSIYQDLNP